MTCRRRYLHQPSSTPIASNLSVRSYKRSNGVAVTRAEQSGPAQAINLILKGIPQSEYQLLLPHLEPVTLEWHSCLHEAKEPIKFGYFPCGGVVSFVVPVSDGRSAEVGMVGREGFVGAPLIVDLERSPHV